MSYALGAIDSDSKDDLHMIREIRNVAAHGLFPFEFKDQTLQQACLLLSAGKYQHPNLVIFKSSDIPTLGHKFFFGACFHYSTMLTLHGADTKNCITPKPILPLELWPPPSSEGHPLPDSKDEA